MSAVWLGGAQGISPCVEKNHPQVTKLDGPKGRHELRIGWRFVWGEGGLSKKGIRNDDHSRDLPS